MSSRCGVRASDRSRTSRKQASRRNALFRLTTTVPVVTIGAVEGTITYSGIAPNSRGLNQINVKLPADVPAGDAVPVVLDDRRRGIEHDNDRRRIAG